MIKICCECGESKAATSENYYTLRGKPNGPCKTCVLGPYGQAKRKAFTQKLRLDVLRAYSNDEPRCACPGCDVATLGFLSLDHINGGGNKQRKELKQAGTTLNLWLRKNNYPPGYQVLCHNCNLSKAFYGICSHLAA